MVIYLTNILLILFWQSIIKDEYKDKKKVLCILYCAQWVLLSGLRAYSVGPDTEAYKLTFLKLKNKTWGELFTKLLEYFANFDSYKDPGYELIAKIFSIWCGQDYTLFLLTIACVFTIPMGIWLYKYSDNICLSFVIYSTLFYSFFAITGHRQTIATSIVVFGGYEFMRKNKIIPMLILQFIAFFIHKSSICFVILYFARFIKINNIYWTIATILILLSFIFRNRLASILGSFLGYEHYAEGYEGAGAYKFTLIFAMIYVITMVFYKELEDTIDNRYMIVAMTIAMFFTSLTFIDSSTMRVVQYFSLFIMLLIPKIITSYDEKTAIVANAFCYLVLIGALFLSNPQYSFVFI